ncbi:MAG TPA: M28 family peptidase, partial [Thermoanaerobaculia bacterium]|nr:M28 family peptidase [Thermoanaerobaculia bacterium]
QGLLGSTAYVNELIQSKKEPPVTYVNVDGGTGRIRGASVYADGRAVADRLRDTFDSMSDLDVVGVLAASGPGPSDSDHFPFAAAGIPAVRFEHDPLRFRTHTWHTDIDTPERISTNDLNASVTVLAAAVWQLANGRY